MGHQRFFIISRSRRNESKKPYGWFNLVSVRIMEIRYAPEKRFQRLEISVLGSSAQLEEMMVG